MRDRPFRSSPLSGRYSQPYQSDEDVRTPTRAATDDLALLIERDALAASV